MIAGVNLDDRLFNGIMQNSSSLTVLDLNNCRGLNELAFVELIKKCVQLKEANFGKTYLNDQNIAFLCNNLTPKIEELSLENEAVYDKDLKTLISRCKNITAIDLRSTAITETAILFISSNLGYTLRKLALPIQFSTSKQIEWEIFIKSMKELKFLWVMFPSTGGAENIVQSYAICYSFDTLIRLKFPHLTLNYPASDPELGPRIAKYFAPVPEIIYVGTEKATVLLNFLRKVASPETQASKRPNEDLPRGSPEKRMQK